MSPGHHLSFTLTREPGLTQVPASASGRRAGARTRGACAGVLGQLGHVWPHVGRGGEVGLRPSLVGSASSCHLRSRGERVQHTRQLVASGAAQREAVLSPRGAVSGAYGLLPKPSGHRGHCPTPQGPCTVWPCALGWGPCSGTSLMSLESPRTHVFTEPWDRARSPSLSHTQHTHSTHSSWPMKATRRI